MNFYYSEIWLLAGISRNSSPATPRDHATLWRHSTPATTHSRRNHSPLVGESPACVRRTGSQKPSRPLNTRPACAELVEASLSKGPAPACAKRSAAGRTADAVGGFLSLYRMQAWSRAVSDGAPGITRDSEGITFRSLALSNGTCKCDRRGRIRTGRHLRFHLSFFAWRRPSVPARIPGRVSRRSSRISSAGRVIRLPLTCCRSGIETCKSHGDDPMLQ